MRFRRKRNTEQPARRVGHPRRQKKRGRAMQHVPNQVGRVHPGRPRRTRVPSSRARDRARHSRRGPGGSIRGSVPQRPRRRSSLRHPPALPASASNSAANRFRRARADYTFRGGRWC